MMLMNPIIMWVTDITTWVQNGDQNIKWILRGQFLCSHKVLFLYLNSVFRDFKELKQMTVAKMARCTANSVILGSRNRGYFTNKTRSCTNRWTNKQKKRKK